MNIKIKVEYLQLIGDVVNRTNAYINNLEVAVD